MTFFIMTTQTKAIQIATLSPLAAKSARVITTIEGAIMLLGMVSLRNFFTLKFELFLADDWKTIFSCGSHFQEFSNVLLNDPAINKIRLCEFDANNQTLGCVENHPE